MRLFEITKSNQQYLYHVTFAKNINKIKKKGLLQFQTSNWVKRSGKRYNQDAGIFAFENARDAVSWASRMRWNFKEPVVIIRIEMEEFWDQDPSEELQIGYGRAMRSDRNISADKIIDVIDIKTPAELGLNADEWIEMSVKKLMS